MTRSTLRSARLAGTLLTSAVALTGACAYQRAYINYDRHEGGMPLAATAFAGESLGVVVAAESGPVWKDCTEVAEAAVWVLIDEARRLGGNAVGDIRWFPGEQPLTTDRPTCRQRWGWVLVWPVLATPAFQVSKVEGTAYRIEATNDHSAGIFVIPESREARAKLVGRIVNGGATGAR